MIVFPLPYIIHIFLMISAFILFASALCIARFKRKKPWWLIRHRRLNITGIALVLTAFATMFRYKAYLGSGHFTNIHGFVGITGIGFLIITPLLSTE